MIDVSEENSTFPLTSPEQLLCLWLKIPCPAGSDFRDFSEWCSDQGLEAHQQNVWVNMCLCEMEGGSWHDGCFSIPSACVVFCLSKLLLNLSRREWFFPTQNVIQVGSSMTFAVKKGGEEKSISHSLAQLYNLVIPEPFSEWFLAMKKAESKHHWNKAWAVFEEKRFNCKLTFWV